MTKININDKIEFPWRAKVRAPHGSSSTNGYTYRYFMLFEEACRCPGRVGPPEYAPGKAWGKRPQWLIDAYNEHIKTL